MPKLLFTSVSSMNLEPIVCGLEKAIKPKIDFQLYRYDEGKEAQYHYDGEVDHNILKRFDSYKPDVVIYSGPAAGKCLPMNDTFAEMRKTAKVIALVCDGGCPNWHPLLQTYKDENLFDLIVNIDGNHDWPRRAHDLTFWGLIDPSYYNKTVEKTVPLGFAGGTGSKHRRDVLERLNRFRIELPNRNESWGTYQDYADFMLRTRAVINFPQTGSGKTTHLKYRIIESGFARCCVFEQSNPITKRYFDAGRDYVEYESVEHLQMLLEKTTEEEMRVCAKNLFDKVHKNYLPIRAWQTVFDSLDVKLLRN